MSYAQLKALTSISKLDLQNELLKCCGSPVWAAEMANSSIAYESLDSLCATADMYWWRQSKDEWIKAFSAHPRIGNPFIKR